MPLDAFLAGVSFGRAGVTFIAALLGGAFYWESRYDTLASMSWAIAVIAVSVFFSMLYVMPPEGKVTKSSMRNAITVTFVVTYFVLLGLFVFFKGESGSDGLPAITDTLVTNFTFLMGVVVAFHFGTTTYEKVAHTRLAAENPGSASAIEAAAEASEQGG